MEVREVAAPHLRQLSDDTGHTVNMAILDELDIVYVERCRSGRAAQREIDLNLHVGARLPAYCRSLAKVLLAFLPLDEQRARLEKVDLARRGPVLSRDGAAAAAINLAVHSSMVSMNDLVARLSPTLRRAADEISAHLGYRP